MDSSGVGGPSSPEGWLSVQTWSWDHRMSKHMVRLLDIGSQGLWRRRGWLKPGRGCQPAMRPLVTSGHWKLLRLLCPKYPSGYSIITTWLDDSCWGCVCGLWGIPQWSLLDFPDCLITLALVFLTWFFLQMLVRGIWGCNPLATLPS